MEYNTMDRTISGNTEAAKSLQRKNTDQDEMSLKDKKKKVIRDIIKKKLKSGDSFNPDPEIEDKDTVVKS